MTNLEICPHEKLAHHIEVVIVGIGTVKLCDACRRKLCTCGRCSAFEALTCKASPPRLSWFYTDSQFGEAQPTTGEDDWCRDGFRQARPWTLEEARRWLGLDDTEDDGLVEEQSRAPKLLTWSSDGEGSP